MLQDRGLSCTTGMENAVFSLVTGNPHFGFSVKPEANTVFEVTNKENIIKLRISYAANSGVSTSVGVKFTGNTSTGNISFELQNVQQNDNGDYTLKTSIGDVLQCQTLYILGKPTTPSITVGNETTVGDNVNLTCRSASTTEPNDHGRNLSYNWTIDGNIDPTGSKYSYSSSRNTLTVSDVTKEDGSKNITCTAYEVVTEGLRSDASMIVSINVLYGPDTVMIHPNTTSYTEEEGKPLSNIQCSSDCNPKCTYKWTKQGQTTEVSNSDTLSIGTVQRSSAGTYSCTVTNPRNARTHISNIIIAVRYGPDLVTLTPSKVDYTENEGMSLSNIQCSAACYPVCTYTWRKQGQAKEVSDTGLLALGPLHKAHAGTYTCTATNPQKAEIKTSQVTIHVRYGPDKAVINVGSTLTVTEGTRPDNLTCTSECYPACSYSWKSMTAGSTASSSNVLYLGQMTRIQAGRYTCTSTNIASEYQHTTEATVDITVLYAPNVTISLTSDNLLENSTLQLRCNPAGVPSSYNYTALTQIWGGQSIPNNRFQISNTPLHSSLQFSGLQLEDTGTYTCHVNNGVSDVDGRLDQTATVTIQVKVSPKVFEEENTFAAAPHNSTMISFPFYSYPVTQNVTFRRQDNVTKLDDGKHKVSFSSENVTTYFYGTHVVLNGSVVRLQLTDLRKGDFTNYTMILTNEYGSTSYTFALVSEAIPEPPIVFRYIGIFNNVPMFYWEKNFNGGYEQHFIIQTTAFGSDNWEDRRRIGEYDQEHLQSNGSYIANITGLGPGSYSARIVTENRLGRTKTSDDLTTWFDIEAKVKLVGTTLPAAAIAGGTASGLVVLIVAVIVAVVFVFKRRRGSGKNEDKRTTELTDRQRLHKSKHVYINCTFSNRKKVDAKAEITEETDDMDEVYEIVEDGVYGNMINMIQRKPILLRKLRELCRSATKDPASMHSEFETIPPKMQYTTQEAMKSIYKDKIRYRVIYPYDQNRVQLPMQPGNFTSDFINASHVRGYKKENAYIASQGAMKSTLEDTWRMIWTQGIEIVVMLTNCFEEGKRKCEIYWPENGKETYGQFTVKTVSEDVFSEFTIRTLSCKMYGSSTTREITHYHFTAWPDKDVPDTCFSLVQLWRKVKYSNKANVNPWMIHCSAGVGRTGTFIALDYLFDQGKEEGEINVHSCVTELRDQRLNMVQTKAQYVFLHQAVLEALDPIAAVCESADYSDMWQNLQKLKPGSNITTHVQADFNEMSVDDKIAMDVELNNTAMHSTGDKFDRFGDSKLPENLMKTRNPEILPPDEYRPMLLVSEKECDNYINAAVLSTYKKADSLIITQVPLANTIIDFLRMVWDYEISTIVLLDDTVPQDCMYWPSSDKERLSIGPFSAKLKKVAVEQAYTLRSIRYTYTGYNGKQETRDVTQFQFKTWHSCVPSNKGRLLKLITDVERVHADTGVKRPIVVQCMDGATKSGLVCVLWAVMERLKYEREVGISETIRFMKARRRQIIPYFEQYTFCYEFVQEYLNSCSEYANVM